MKKHIFAIIFAIGISVSVNAAQTYGQSEAFRIDVPFAFTANNKSLTPGTYLVTPATDSKNLWRLQSLHDKPEVFLLAGSLSSPSAVGGAGLTFHRYGDRNFLVSLKSFSYLVKLPATSSEKALRRTLNAVVNNAPAIVEAVASK